MRYDRLPLEINKLVQQRQSIDQRIAEAQREQHSLLGYPTALICKEFIAGTRSLA